MRPLEHITVIDMTTYAAGPAATRILADMGADVIKIEPLGGEAFRVWGQTNHLPIEVDENPAFELNNAGKRGIALDLKSREGRDIIHRLLQRADVFCSNYRQKALEKLGLTYEELHAQYPKLVYGFCSGYGSKGPRAAAPGFDYVAYWARGGIMEATGEPGGNPAQIIPAAGDQASGVILAGAICAALVGAQHSGVGEKVEVSLYQSALWFSSPHLLKAYYGGADRASRMTPSVPLLNCFQCSDGRWIAIAILEHERYWPVVCKVIGREDLLADPRFSRFKDAQKNSTALTEILDGILAQKSVDEWERIFDENDIACQRLFTAQEINDDEQALANGYLRPVHFRSGKTIHMATPPFHCTSQEPPQPCAAPRLGEHTVEVLRQAGYSNEEIAAYREHGVVGVWEP